jgi:hypothetical protein
MDKNTQKSEIFRKRGDEHVKKEEYKQAKAESMQKYMQKKREQTKEFRSQWNDTQVWLEQYVKKNVISEPKLKAIEIILSSL